MCTGAALRRRWATSHHPPACKRLRRTCLRTRTISRSQAPLGQCSSSSSMACHRQRLSTRGEARPRPGGEGGEVDPHPGRVTAVAGGAGDGDLPAGSTSPVLSSSCCKLGVIQIECQVRAIREGQPERRQMLKIGWGEWLGCTRPMHSSTDSTQRRGVGSRSRELEVKRGCAAARPAASQRDAVVSRGNERHNEAQVH